MSLINTSHPSSQHIHTSPLSPPTSMPLLPLLLILLPRCYHYYYHYYYGLVQTERRWSPMGPRFLEEGVRTPQTKVNRLGSSPKPANPSLSSDPLHQQLAQQTLASPAFQSPCHLTPTFSHVFYFENFYKSTPNFATSVNPWFNFQFPLLIWSLALFTGVLLCLARFSLFQNLLKGGGKHRKIRQGGLTSLQRKITK